ncbi:putative ribonuclease H-like domain-containing protein [Tanacetum coccineum]
MEESFKPVIQPQRRLNLKVQDVVKDDIVRLLDSGLIYPISDSPWVSLIHVVPKKGRMTVVLNENNKLIPSRTVTGWRVCIDYRFFQIRSHLKIKEKTTFTYPYGTFAYRRTPFGLCNAPATFQRCMMAIFHDTVEDFMEVFMDDFSVFEVMEFESAHSNTTAKLPILKLENGNSWVSVPQTAQENGTSVIKMLVPVTAEEKTNTKNDVKDRSLLLMALPNEHQLTFSQYTDAKTIASSTKSLDSIFNRLLKIVSRLAILGVVIAQEDLNLKFLSSLPPEWNTQVVVWMNKDEIKTMSIDDLYNKFKIIEQNVKKSVGASSGAQNLAFMTAPSTSSTNDVNTAKPAYEVSTVSPNVNTTSPQVSTASFSDNAVNGFEVAALSAKYEGKEVECFNCHKMGHFAREYKAPKNKEGQFRNQDNTRKQGNNEDTSFKAMLAIDGVEPEFKAYGSEDSNQKASHNRMTHDLLRVDAQGKQHRASCKSKVLNPITKPLFMLHMDLFGPTFVSSLMHKKYCLVVTDDYSRFTWVFFLTTKDETSEILKNFIKEIENLVDKKVKIIRSDNGTEFKNKVMDDFCREKGIKREYSIARTPQQNGVAERRNRTLIEAARTMLADSKLPTTFWAEVVSTACYVQNRVLVVKPHNKTPYELFRGFKPALSFMKPFGCHVTILNTLDSLGKFDGKSDEGFFVGYSLSSKAFRVYNTRTRRVEENLHIGFLENKPMIEGNGPKWLFDIDSLTQSMNYVPVAAGTIINESASTQGELNAGTSEEISQDCIVMPIWKDASYFDSPSKDVDIGELKFAADDQKQVEYGLDNKNDEKDNSYDNSSPKEVNAAGQHVTTASPTLEATHDTKIPQSSGPPVKVGDEAVHKELGDRMERDATTASSLEAEQDSGNINRTQSMATLNGSSP